MSRLLEKIRSRGHWQVIIRPTTFLADRIPDIRHLYPLVQHCSVHLRGWDYPHVDRQTGPVIGKDWVGQEFEWEEYLEVWRLYQSGQFVHLFGMEEDWRERSTWRTDHGEKPGQVLGLGNALFQYTEIFEFAARLALTEAGGTTMHLEVAVNGLHGRSLVNERPGGRPVHGRPGELDSLPFSIDISQADLVADARELALKPASDLFFRFGKDFSQEVLRAHQAALLDAAGAYR